MFDIKKVFPIYYPKKEEIFWGKKLGEGISEVYEILYKERKYAGKIYKDTKIEDLSYELNIAAKIKENLQCVKTHGVICLEEDVILLMEIINCHGDVYDYTSKIAKWTPCYMKNNVLVPEPKTDYVYFNKDENIYWCYELSEKQKMKIALSFVKAIDELHDSNIIHGDVKTNNIVLEYGYKRQNVKLIDFGMSYHSNDDNFIDIERRCGTEGYRAPEQESYQLCKKSDIYSLGVSIIEIWNGDIWHDATDFKGNRKDVLRGLRKIEKNDKYLGDLLRKTISLKPKKRPNTKEILIMLKHVISKNGHKYKSNPRN